MPADLSGRTGGYRDQAIRCSGCAEPMRRLSLPKADAEVDVCDGCGGAWIDWFDGDLRAVATETLRLSDAGTAAGGRGASPPSADAQRPSRNEAIAVGACPRCTKQLVTERYVLTAHVPSARVEGKISVVSGPTGAELLRCEDCMGAFVSRTSAEVLSFLSDNDEPPPSQAKVAVKPLPWERFMALIRALLGSKD